MTAFGQPVQFREFSEGADAVSLERIRLEKSDTKSLYDEGWLQKIIHRSPQILPVAAIEPAFESWRAICIELPTSVGYVDNLLVTPYGDLILVECKLWRNPQARREVVAQIIDYAQSMSRWRYDDLEGAIQRARCDQISLYQLASDESFLTEERFVSSVSRNLALGRVLLLIVGDGIRAGVEGLTDYLQSHVGFHFSMALVEMAIFKHPTEASFIIQPYLQARTTLIERGIVRIDQNVVRIEPPLPVAAKGVTPTSARTSISEESFFEEMALTDRDLADSFRRFLDVAGEHGIYVKPRKNLNLYWGAEDGTEFNLGYVSADGILSSEAVGWKPFDFGRVDLAHDYLINLAKIVDGYIHKTPAPHQWAVKTPGSKAVDLHVLLPKQNEWLALIDEYTDRLREMLKGREDAN